MTTIGTLNIALSGDTANYTTKLEAARKGTKTAVSDMKSAGGGGIFGGLTESVTSVSAGLLAAGEVVHVFGEVLHFAGEIASRAAETIAEWVGETTRAVDAAYKMAGALGISTQALMSLGQAAKVEANIPVEDFTGLLTKMTKAIGEVNLRGGPAKEALDMMGLSAKTLAALPVDKQFLAIADSISRLKNPTDQAIAATDLFGKKGATLLPILTQGAEAIRESQRAAVEYGTALSQIDAAKIEQSHRAVQELGDRWEGIKNTVVVSLVPAIATIAVAIGEVIPPAEELKGIFAGLLFYVADVGDILNTMTDTLLKMQRFDIVGLLNTKPDHTLTDFLEDANKRAERLAGAMSHIKTPHIDTEAAEHASKLKSALDNIKLESATAGMDSFNKRLTDFIVMEHPSAAQAVEFANALKHIGDVAKQTKLDGILSGLQTQAATAGLNGMEKVFFELTQSGASLYQIIKGLTYESAIEQAQHLKDIHDEIKRMTEDTLSPIEKYVAAMKHIADLQKEGLGAEVAKRAAIKANQELLASMKNSDPGTFTAREVRFGMTPNVGRTNDTMSQIKTVLDQQLKKQADQLKEEQLTNQLLRDNGIAVVDIGV